MASALGFVLSSVAFAAIPVVVLLRATSRRGGDSVESDFYEQYHELERRHRRLVGWRRIFLTVLDFRCGAGAFLPCVERYGPFTAVDGDESAVAFCHCRGRSEVRHVPPGPLPFEDGTFELVTSLDVLEHIEHDVAALTELRRVLRGGTLLLAVPAFMFLWGEQDVISHHHRRFTAPELAGRLREAGLHVTRTSYFNTLLFPPVVAVRLVRRALRAPSAEKTDFTIGPPALNAVLGRAFGAEAGILWRRRLPSGVSVLAVAQR